MTEEDFRELQKLYVLSSDAVAHVIDVEQTNDNADGDGADETNYYGRVCKFARLVMSELEDIGITFPSGAEMLDDYTHLHMIAVMNNNLNSDKFLSLLRAMPKPLVERFMRECLAEDLPADDWYEVFLFQLQQAYPINTEFGLLRANADLVYVTPVFRDRIIKILDHISTEDTGDEQ